MALRQKKEKSCGEAAVMLTNGLQADCGIAPACHVERSRDIPWHDQAYFYGILRLRCASLRMTTSESERVERKAPWEPRRVEGDGHVIATCGFTRPRSFTEESRGDRSTTLSSPITAEAGESPAALVQA